MDALTLVAGKGIGMPCIVSRIVDDFHVRKADTPHNDQPEHGGHHGPRDGFGAIGGFVGEGLGSLQ